MKRTSLVEAIAQSLNKKKGDTTTISAKRISPSTNTSMVKVIDSRQQKQFSVNATATDLPTAYVIALSEQELPGIRVFSL